MKTINYIIFALASFVIFPACDPIEDRESLGEKVSESDIRISVSQSTDKDNIVYLENKTPSVIPYWDYGTGYSSQQKDTILIPFAGTYDISFTAWSAGGPTTVVKQVVVSQNDPDYFADEVWGLLTNNGEGKTWVWALDCPGGFPYGNGPEDCLAPVWWTVNVAGLADWGIDKDEMYFDLKGAANYTITKTSGVTKAFFDVSKMEVAGVVYPRLKIIGGGLSRDEGGTGVYHIVKITEDELIVHQDYNVAIYKRKGFMYP